MNTCLKAVVQCRSAARTTSCVVLGQGPIGLMFTMLVERARHAASWPPIRFARGCELPHASARESRWDPRDDRCRRRNVEEAHRRPRRRPGDCCGIRARIRRAGDRAARVRAPGSCCSRRLPTRNGSRSPAPTSVSESVRCSAATALRWISEGIRRSGIQRRAAGGRADFPPPAAGSESVQASNWHCIRTINR